MRPFLLSFLFTMFVGAVSAQYYDASPSIVIGADLGIPVGPFTKTHGFGGGLTGKVRFPAGLLSDVILTGNIAVFTGKTYQDGNGKQRKASIAKSLSAFVGYRYYLNPLSDYNSFYIQGDLGLSAATTKIINPAIAPSLGYLINDRIDLSLRYQTVLSSNAYAKLSFITFNFAYGINL